MAAEQVVLFEQRGHIGIFTLNRPKAMNAISGQVSEQFEAHLEKFEADDDLWIGIVESSHPKTFCAGADLKSVNKGENIQTAKGGFAGFVNFPRTKPMIAAVDGNALAGGCEIVLACDLVVASKKAAFGVPEVKRSLIPAAGGLFRLPQKIPLAIAMELMLTGDPITCERAYQVGLVNHICEEGRENTMKAALALADRISANAPLAVREAKACVDEFVKAAVSDNDAFNRSIQGLGELMQTPDFMEGPLAFIEKRAPNWSGKRSKL
jgi:enoyl-CoA hydratase